MSIDDSFFFFFFQAEDGIRDVAVTGVQTCALPISPPPGRRIRRRELPARSAVPPPAPRAKAAGHWPGRGSWRAGWRGRRRRQTRRGARSCDSLLGRKVAGGV